MRDVVSSVRIWSNLHQPIAFRAPGTTIAGTEFETWVRVAAIPESRPCLLRRRSMADADGEVLAPGCIRRPSTDPPLHLHVCWEGHALVVDGSQHFSYAQQGGTNNL